MDISVIVFKRVGKANSWKNLLPYFKSNTLIIDNNVLNGFLVFFNREGEIDVGI